MQRLHSAAVQLAVLIIAIAAQQTASADQIVSLRNTSSNLFLDVVGAQTNDGQPVVLFDFNGNANQLFDISLVRDPGINPLGGPTDPVGNTIQPRHSFKCLGVAGASMNDLAPIVQTTCVSDITMTSAGRAQLWEVESIGNSCPPPGCFPIGFRIRNLNSGKCVDARNPNFPTPPPRNAPLQQFTCARDTNDRWFVNQTFDFSSPGPGPVVH
jgi:hypothetical protein